MMTEQERIKRLENVIRILVDAINCMPCCIADFIGTDNYMEVEGALNNTKYIGRCNWCGEFVDEQSLVRNKDDEKFCSDDCRCYALDT